MDESGKKLYLSIYNSLPRDAKEAMFELWMSGRNDSGVWVRFRDVEAAVGRIVDAVQHEKDDSPTIDAVTIVRCIKCKHMHQSQLEKWCWNENSICYAKKVTNRWYCADGIQKEE